MHIHKLLCRSTMGLSEIGPKLNNALDSVPQSHSLYDCRTETSILCAINITGINLDIMVNTFG